MRSKNYMKTASRVSSTPLGGGGGGEGNTIPCNWKEIYRGYKLSATCVQHSKCTVHRG